VKLGLSPKENCSKNLDFVLLERRVNIQAKGCTAGIFFLVSTRRTRSLHEHDRMFTVGTFGFSGIAGLFSCFLRDVQHFILDKNSLY